MARSGVDYGRSRLMTAARRTHRENLIVAAEFLEALEDARPKPVPKESLDYLKVQRTFYQKEADRCQREGLPAQASRMWKAAEKVDDKIRRIERRTY